MSCVIIDSLADLLELIASLYKTYEVDNEIDKYFIGTTVGDTLMINVCLLSSTTNINEKIMMSSANCGQIYYILCYSQT